MQMDPAAARERDEQEQQAEPQQAEPQSELDFELPAKQCDIGRPEGCESCQ